MGKIVQSFAQLISPIANNTNLTNLLDVGQHWDEIAIEFHFVILPRFSFPKVIVAPTVDIPAEV